MQLALLENLVGRRLKVQRKRLAKGSQGIWGLVFAREIKIIRLFFRGIFYFLIGFLQISRKLVLLTFQTNYFLVIQATNNLALPNAIIRKLLKQNFSLLSLIQLPEYFLKILNITASNLLHHRHSHFKNLQIHPIPFPNIHTLKPIYYLQINVDVNQENQKFIFGNIFQSGFSVG